MLRLVKQREENAPKRSNAAVAAMAEIIDYLNDLPYDFGSDSRVEELMDQAFDAGVEEGKRTTFSHAFGVGFVAGSRFEKLGGGMDLYD